MKPKIWITGHRGMLGSAMCRTLAGVDAELLLTTRNEVDLYNQSQVLSWMRINRPDYVFHIGVKVGGIGANKKMPADFIVDNLLIQTNVLQGAHLTSVKRLVFVASNCTYPSVSAQPIPETALLSGPPDENVRAYAVSKIAGIFNVGWLSFRRDPEGLACLARWREQCLQWCRDEPEAGRFGDQGYLDEWPEKYERVKVVDRPGFNEAPWNIKIDKISKDGEPVQIGTHPLVFFHFQGLRRIGPKLFNPNWHDYLLPVSRRLIQRVYRPYLAAIKEAESQAGLQARVQDFVRANRRNPKNSLSNLCRWPRNFYKVISGYYVVMKTPRHYY